MLELVKFLKEHPDDWEDLLTQAPYYLHIKKGDGPNKGAVLFKYDQFNSDFYNPIVQEARGIILDQLDGWRVIRMSFRKFFNYGQPEAADIDWSTARVQEKEDGSLMSISWWPRQNRYLISTNGTIDAFRTKVCSPTASFLDSGDDAPTFADLFMEGLAKSPVGHLHLYEIFRKGYTYTFELCSPLNKVVVDWKETTLFHLATRNNETLEEENEDIGIQKPKEFPLHSFDAVVDAAQKINRIESDTVEHEGFVVVDGNWSRVKIKSPLYVSAFYIAGNSLSFKRALGIIICNEEDEFVSYFPDTQKVFNEVHQFIDRIEAFMEEGWKHFSSLPAQTHEEFYGLVKDSQFASFYLDKEKFSDLTAHQFLFGGYRFWSLKDKAYKLTPPVRKLARRMKELYTNADKEETWRY